MDEKPLSRHFLNLIPSKEKLILYVKPNGLNLVFLKIQDTIHLDFPPTAVDNLEIVDQIAFKTLIDSFFSLHNLKGIETIVLLSEKMMISKKFSGYDIEQNPFLLKEFFDKIPLSPGNIKKDNVRVNDTVYAYAVNKPICEIILSVARKHGIPVISVVPAPVFKELHDKETPTMEEFVEFSKNRYINFFNLFPSETLYAAPLYFKKNILGFVSFLIVAVCVFTLLSRIQQPNEVSKSAISPTAIPTPTREPLFSKSDYTITILNGSGIRGQAAQVQEQLESEGYTVADVGNADKDTYIKTVIAAHTSVPQTFIRDLKTILLKDYTVSDSTETFTVKKDSDIIIYTGPGKSSVNSSP